MRIQHLSSGGGLIVTYRCTARCAHCLYRSSPWRDPAYMEGELVRALVRKAVSLGCRSFHIGGGEPFLNIEGLLRVIRILREEGVAIEYLETNAFWYQDPSSACALLERILVAGCSTLMVSVCPFHIPFVPLCKVDGAVAACERVGMRHFLWQDQYYPELARLDKNKTHSLDELSAQYGPHYVVQAAARFGLWVNGRALETFRPYLELRPAEEILRAEPDGCRELTRTTHFHLDLYGNYVPPGCVGFALDHSLLGEEIPESHRLYHLLLKDGIRGLYEYAQKEQGFTPHKDGYVSKCDLCYGIRKTLLQDAAEPPNDSTGRVGLPVEPEPAAYYLKGSGNRRPLLVQGVHHPELGPVEFYWEDRECH